MWEYWLGKTKKVAANSTIELFFWLAKRLFRKKGNRMGFSKEIVSGDAGSLIISEDSGVAKLALVGSVSLGGGSMAGVVKAKASVEVDVSAQQLIDAGLELAAHKYPAAAPLIEMAKKAIDAELAKP